MAMIDFHKDFVFRG